MRTPAPPTAVALCSGCPGGLGAPGVPVLPVVSLSVLLTGPPPAHPLQPPGEGRPHPLLAGQKSEVSAGRAGQHVPSAQQGGPSLGGGLSLRQTSSSCVVHAWPTPPQCPPGVSLLRLGRHGRSTPGFLEPAAGPVPGRGGEAAPWPCPSRCGAGAHPGQFHTGLRATGAAGPGHTCCPALLSARHPPPSSCACGACCPGRGRAEGPRGDPACWRGPGPQRARLLALRESRTVLFVSKTLPLEETVCRCRLLFQNGLSCKRPARPRGCHVGHRGAT